MSNRRLSGTLEDDNQLVSLRLTAAERDAILSSRHVADLDVQDRVRDAPARRGVTFEMEELEDLHRCLAFDAKRTDDAKRRRTISKVLGKIEESLEAFTDDDPQFDLLEGAAPANSHEFFQQVFQPCASDIGEPLPSCTIRLSAAHRATLRGMDTISEDIHKMLAVASEEEVALEFNFRQFIATSLALKEALDQSADALSARPYWEVAEKMSRSIYQDIEEAVGDERSPALEDVVYQLKITLDNSKPPIWRRVLVADCTLGELHAVIQTAMGWTNSHLHLFEYGKDRFSDPRFELGQEDYDEESVTLSQLRANGCKKLRYCYDFGDGWMHTIQFEKTLERKPADFLPRCTKGAGACPPEDCGGIGGYYELIEVLQNPTHERYEELREWIDDEFDAAHFDIDETNVALAAGPDDWYE